MSSSTHVSVTIQTSEQSVPSVPDWFGEVVLIIEHLRKQGALTKLSERVRFSRRRFGHYEVIDFLAVLAGLCHRRRTDIRGLLPEATTVCGSLHGIV